MAKLVKWVEWQLACVSLICRVQTPSVDQALQWHLTNPHTGYRLGQVFVITTKLIKLLRQHNVNIFVSTTEDVLVTASKFCCTKDDKYALTLFFTLVLPLCTYLTRGSQNTQTERELLLSYSGKRRQALVRHVKKQANIIINTLRNHPCHCGRAIVYTSIQMRETKYIILFRLHYTFIFIWLAPTVCNHSKQWRDNICSKMADVVETI